MVVSQAEEVIPSQRRIKMYKMYFDCKSFHKSVIGYFVFLPTILNQNWGGGLLDDASSISERKWSGFGNFLGQFMNWYKYKPSNVTRLMFSVIWLVWVLLVMAIKTIGIVFKVLIWLFVLPAPWLLFSITNNIKLDKHPLPNLSQ